MSQHQAAVDENQRVVDSLRASVERLAAASDEEAIEQAAKFQGLHMRPAGVSGLLAGMSDELFGNLLRLLKGQTLVRPRSNTPAAGWELIDTSVS